MHTVMIASLFMMRIVQVHRVSLMHSLAAVCC